MVASSDDPGECTPARLRVRACAHIRTANISFEARIVCARDVPVQVRVWEPRQACSWRADWDAPVASPE